MESKAPGFLLSSSRFHACYSQTKEGGSIIDLGLSLGTQQHENYHSSGHMMGLDGYGELIDWSQSSCSDSRLKNHAREHGKFVQEECSNETIEEGDGVGSRGKWAYVKVNMDGFVVGRKVCVHDHGGYTSLARRLEDMFGMLSVSGLGLLEVGSEFSLVYQDKEGTWRNVGDVPWREFVESVKRLRIARRDDARLAFATTTPFN
ncbi:PREDICTED: auxin-responsive protein IAA32 [Tarenaya hassleriana]|uniref:auxin-responsive protein IAA32 n=1 Tax=Tarenaya hassleriana TaxID=28532 RepID=UPI00053C3B52|nr:PREDICTED: auxin-responsive protein IAA32 [Tarenaya hassleriana]